MSADNTGFILREDAALKAHLRGIKLTDANAPVGGRDVPVYFRLPEQEARARNYPYVTIDLLAVVRDTTREHRGTYYFAETSQYTPPGRALTQVASTDWPIPMTLTYQVTSFARFIQHDRQITTALLTDEFPVRFGFVEMVPGDGWADDSSIRRLDFVGGPVHADQPDPADPNKRIFRKSYTVEVSSEMFLSEIRNLDAVLAPEVIVDVQLYAPPG